MFQESAQHKEVGRKQLKKSEMKQESALKKSEFNGQRTTPRLHKAELVKSILISFKFVFIILIFIYSAFKSATFFTNFL